MDVCTKLKDETIHPIFVEIEEEITGSPKSEDFSLKTLEMHQRFRAGFYQRGFVV